MQALLRSSLIVAGLAFTAAVGSTPALAGHHDHGNKRVAQQKNQSSRHAAPPAAYHQLYGNAPAAPKSVQRNRHADRRDNGRRVVERNRNDRHAVGRDRGDHRFADRDRDRDRNRNRDWRHDRDRHDYDRQDHDRRRVDRHDRDHDWDRHHRNIYVRRNFAWGFGWTNHWDRYHDNGWLRYRASRFGYVPRHNRVFAGYGADWMWWGGAYDPFDPPLGYRNCYPVIRYGYYDHRRAQLGGTMCYRHGDTYLLPNSVFVIAIF